MDQRKIGAFIAQLRREKGWTQEELGERLGVTNKTVSRWENGNYMPDIQMLSLLGREFEVSLNELVQGRRLESEASFRAAAEDTLLSVLERPGLRLRRWLGRHLLSVTVIFLLSLLLVTAFFLYADYQNAHPADLSPPGSYASDMGNGIYLVFTQEGAFYRFRQGEPFLEQGRYTQWKDRITVVTDSSGTYQLLIKADKLYERDKGGSLISYTKYHDLPVFFGNGPEEAPGG